MAESGPPPETRGDTAVVEMSSSLHYTELNRTQDWGHMHMTCHDASCYIKCLPPSSLGYCT